MTTRRMTIHGGPEFREDVEGLLGSKQAAARGIRTLGDLMAAALASWAREVGLPTPRARAGRWGGARGGRGAKSGDSRQTP